MKDNVQEVRKYEFQEVANGVSSVSNVMNFRSAILCLLNANRRLSLVKSLGWVGLGFVSFGLASAAHAQRIVDIGVTTPPLQNFMRPSHWYYGVQEREIVSLEW
jgi:hypothetical protein